MKELLQYCDTQRRREYVEAMIKHGTTTKASRALGVSRRVLNRGLKAVRDRAAKQGHSPDHDMHHTVPDGFLVKGTSTLYKEGQPVLQWVKSNIDRERQQELLLASLAAMSDDIPKYEPTPYSQPDTAVNTDIIPWLMVGDAHIGALIHSMECSHGQNFDLKIAEQELCLAVKLLIDRAPVCERAVINDLGDMTHYENMSATTEASGHALDQDTRFSKMIAVYSRITRFIVEYALTKFKYVDVIINRGNHSETNDVWMAELLRVKYADEPRLHILDNAGLFIPYRMGNTFCMSHHGHKAKNQKLIDVMATNFRHDFGEAKYKYIDTGHYHHQSSNNVGDVVSTTWNNLAPEDKYANDGGWRSRQFITLALRSKTYGQTGTITVPVEEVKDIISNQDAGAFVERRNEVYTV